jgi:hypothetical protein
MADQVVTKSTSLAPEEAIVRAVQYFTTGRWRAQTQSNRMATFVGRPSLPIGLVIVMIVGFAFCIVPGVIAYILLVRKAMQLQNIVVSANPILTGSEVIVKHAPGARKLVAGFFQALP